MYHTFVQAFEGAPIRRQERQFKAKVHIKKYDDPGHGWYAVKKSFLNKLGIADKISACSYEKGATAYVEEDGDGSLLIDTLVALKVPFTVEYKHTNTNSPIRSYNCYQR